MDDTSRRWKVALVSGILVAAGMSGCAPTGNDSAASPSPTQSAEASVEGTILFTRAGGRYGDETVFIADAEFQDERQLSPDGAACCARLSPDGAVALLLENDQPAGLPLGSSTLPAEGGEFTRLPAIDPDVNLVAATWAPDGTSVASEGWVAADGSDGRAGVYITSYPDGQTVRQITMTDNGGHDAPVDFSPDGTQLVFFRGQPEPDWDIGGSLWIAQTDGSGVQQIDTGDVAPSWWARWSPDGQRILFATGRMQGDGAVWVVNPDGTDLTELYRAEPPEFPITPVWSPDGRQILFAIDPHDNQFAHPANRVVVMDADGGEPTTLIDDTTFKRNFSWIP